MRAALCSSSTTPPLETRSSVATQGMHGACCSHLHCQTECSGANLALTTTDKPGRELTTPPTTQAVRLLAAVAAGHATMREVVLCKYTTACAFCVSKKIVVCPEKLSSASPRQQPRRASPARSPRNWASQQRLLRRAPERTCRTCQLALGQRQQPSASPLPPREPPPLHVRVFVQRFLRSRRRKGPWR